MAYEKITEGTNEFCKIVSTNVSLSTKAEIEKLKKDLVMKMAVIQEAYDAEITELDLRLEVFK